jgi:hypothetical protein
MRKPKCRTLDPRGRRSDLDRARDVALRERPTAPSGEDEIAVTTAAGGEFALEQLSERRLDGGEKRHFALARPGLSTG